MSSLFFTNTYWSLPRLIKLSERQSLGGIAILAGREEELIELVRFAKATKVPLLLLKSSDFLQDLRSFVQSQRITRGYCLGFPEKITLESIRLFEDGIWNFHFGALPTYAGPDPLFWILKNGEKTVTLVCHRMDENWDAGCLLKQVVVPIFPGENYGMLGARLSQKTAEMIDSMLSDTTLSEKAIKLSPNPKPTRRPRLDDLLIDWENQSSDQIENLVNACNPSYGGARSTFGSAQIHILEVSPAMVRDTALFGPGSIVHATPEDGLFVLCSDYKYLKINILKTPECILSGSKLAALGLKKGTKLGKTTHLAKNSILIS